MALLQECPQCKEKLSLKSKTVVKEGEEVKKTLKERKECPSWRCDLKSPKVYWIEYYYEGRRKRERIGTNKALAQTVLQKRLVERAEGKLLDKKKVNNYLFSDLVKQYDEWSKVNNKSYEVNKKYYISKVKGFFGSMLLREITPWHIEKFKLERSKETGKTEVNRELATLKHIFSKGVEWGKVQANPSRGVKKFKEKNARIRFLMPDQFYRLYDHLPYPLNAITKVAVLSGLRKDNILSLKWPFIDSQNRMLNVPETKNSEPLKIPISQPLLDLLNSISRHPESEYVFCKPDGNRYQNIDFDQLREALEKAGIEGGFHFHDLRHTAASHLVMSGIDLATVKEILGHKDISMTMRYAHLAPDHKRNAMETLGKVFSVDTYMDTKPEREEKKITALSR